MAKPMTVAELRDVLAGHDQEMLVVVNGYEGGYDNPVLNHGKAVLGKGQSRPDDWWMGEHRRCRDYTTDPEAVEVLVVARPADAGG